MYIQETVFIITNKAYVSQINSSRVMSQVEYQPQNVYVSSHD